MNIRNRMRRESNNENEEEMIKPLLKIKPKFNFLRVLTTKHLGTLATLIFIGTLVVQNSGINILYFLLVLGIYLLYLLFKMFNLKRKYKKTAYLFFEDRIIILKKYGRQENTMVPYGDIVDILFYQSYAEKFFKMGSLGIKISGGNIFNNIIMLESIEDLYGTIEKIQSILNRNY